MTRYQRAILSAIVLLAMASGPAAATAPGDYPARPIRFIVPSAPGGTPDVISRVLAAELSRQMGQQVVVDNRPGANGGIGLHLLAKAVPDGYTFGYGPVSAVAIN